MMKFLLIEVEETLKHGRKEEEHLKSAQVKMDEVREENERLKFTISQMMEDYESLKMHFHDIVQADQLRKSIDSAPMTASDDESELVSLRLGRFPGDAKGERTKGSNVSKHQNNRKQLGGLELALDFKLPSARVSRNRSLENSLDGSKEQENNAFHRSTKTARSGDDEILEHNPLKKPRVSVRAICDTQTMNDGCQWRKYGQKIAKGNPCPRAYYSCTLSSSCPVRKQVQRWAENMSILTTTYEGTHNHPLPASAITMATTTSAAAAMLKCGSSASLPPPSGVSSTSPNLLRLNFASSYAVATPCSAQASISTSQSHPTIALDATAANQTSSPYNKSSFSGFFPGLSSSSSSTACLNFSTSASDHSLDYSNALQSTVNATFESSFAAAVTSFIPNGDVDNLDQERLDSGQNANCCKNINFSEPYSMPSGCYWMNSQQKNLASFPRSSVQILLD